MLPWKYLGTRVRFPPPPFDRVPQPVSIETGPVSNHWRALLVWCTYRGICEGWRRRPAQNRVTRWPPVRPEKSRNGPGVSKSRDVAPTRHAMEVAVNLPVTETEFFPVWRDLPVGGQPKNCSPRNSAKGHIDGSTLLPAVRQGSWLVHGQRDRLN